MKKDDLRMDASILLKLSPESVAIEGTYIGPTRGHVPRAAIRFADSTIDFFDFEAVELDPIRHWSKSFGTQRICACGHSYDRHFDGYEQDPVYPLLPSPVGCKYCGCSHWHEPTVENQLNRLQDHAIYDIQLLKPQTFEYHVLKDAVRDHRSVKEKAPVIMPTGALLTELHIFHADVYHYNELHEPSYSVLYGINYIYEDKQWSSSPLKSGEFTVLGRKWAQYHGKESEVYLESFQPEGIRLGKPPKEE